MGPPGRLRRLDRSIRELGEMLEATGWLRELSWPQIESLARHLRAVAAPPSSVIFEEGDPAASLCLVVTGKVAVVKRDSAGRRRTLAILGPGKAFGELSLVDREPRSAAALAVEDTTLLVLDEAGFERLSADVPRLAVQLLLKIARLVSQRLRQTSGVLVEKLER